MHQISPHYPASAYVVKMAHDPDTPSARWGSSASFHTTRWSLVLSAQQPSSSDASTSLEALCQQYWRPLYAYVRHRGYTTHDAQDLTQEFFARLLQKQWLNAVDPAKGRFRSFLLMAMKRFLANEWDRSRAQKRGAGLAIISLDAAVAEHLLAQDLSTQMSPDSAYERRWALTLLENVMHRLRQEHEQVGRLSDYELLKPCLTAGRKDVHYQELATALGMEPASVRSAVHRLRKRFREIFRDEVTATLADPAEVEDEMRAVIAALGAG